jgi:hypothetical protein
MGLLVGAAVTGEEERWSSIGRDMGNWSQWRGTSHNWAEGVPFARVQRCSGVVMLPKPKMRVLLWLVHTPSG